MAFEKLVLLERFDAFGDHVQVQGVGHDDNGLDDFHVLGGFWNVLDERPVDLQGVQRQALEVSQGGIASAEVIDRQRYAQGAYLLQQHQGIGNVAHQRILGDLQFQAMGFDPGIAQGE
ncbi:hypothetical protein D3C84_948580 [compost metagenome]